MDIDIVWAGLAAVPIVAGLIQVARQIGMPANFAPLLAVVLGLAGSVGFSYSAGEATIQVAVAQGLAIGLSSSGFYSWIRTGADVVETVRANGAGGQ